MRSEKELPRPELPSALAPGRKIRAKGVQVLLPPAAPPEATHGGRRELCAHCGMDFLTALNIKWSKTPSEPPSFPPAREHQPTNALLPAGGPTTAAPPYAVPTCAPVRKRPPQRPRRAVPPKPRAVPGLPQLHREGPTAQAPRCPALPIRGSPDPTASCPRSRQGREERWEKLQGSHTYPKTSFKRRFEPNPPPFPPPPWQPRGTPALPAESGLRKSHQRQSPLPWHVAITRHEDFNLKHLPSYSR